MNISDVTLPKVKQFHCCPIMFSWSISYVFLFIFFISLWLVPGLRAFILQPSCVWVPEPPLGQTPGADPLHAALQVEQSSDGLFQTLFVLLVFTLLFKLLGKKKKTKHPQLYCSTFFIFFLKLKSWYNPCPSLWLMFLPSVCQKGADSGKRVWAAVWEEHTERLLWILHRWTGKKKRSTFENPSSIKLQGNVGNIQK